MTIFVEQLWRYPVNAPPPPITIERPFARFPQAGRAGRASAARTLVRSRVRWVSIAEQYAASPRAAMPAGGGGGRADPNSRRDYAVLLLLCRLGLHGGDVAELRFEDIDWPRAPGAVAGAGEVEAARRDATGRSTRRWAPRCKRRSGGGARGGAVAPE